MKKIAPLLAAAVLCLALGGCSGEERLSDEEVVNAFLLAYQQGNYEGMRPYMDDVNPLHQFFACMDEGTGGELAPVYRACFEKTKTAAWTAGAVEGQETWGAVDVELAISNCGGALRDAMAAAIQGDVSAGSGGFRDMPGWMARALEGEAETVRETYRLHVGSRDGEMVMDTNTNRQFFAALCGGLREYLDVSMTTCAFPDGSVWELAARGDEIVGLVRTESAAGAGMYAEADLALVIQNFTAPYETMGGVWAGGEVQGDLLISRFGVDMETASSFDLVQMGLIDRQTTAGSNGWLSLESTVSGFTRDGAVCETETFRPDKPAG